MSLNSYMSAAGYDLMPEVRSILAVPIRNFIDGGWLDAGTGVIFENLDPVSDEVVVRVFEIPAVALGNTVIFKPPSDTPVAAGRMTELLQEAGLPDGIMNLIQGHGSGMGACLAGHSGISKVTFTGSTEAGVSIGKAKMNNMTGVSPKPGDLCRYGIVAN